MGHRAGLDGRKISSPLGFNPGPSSRSQSLYRLSYPAHDYECKRTNYSLIIDYRCNPKLLHVYILSGKEIIIDDRKSAETSSQEDSTSQKMAYTALLMIMAEETWFSTLHQSELKPSNTLSFF